MTACEVRERGRPTSLYVEIEPPTRNPSRRNRSMAQLVRDIRAHAGHMEQWPTPPETDCRVSPNVGDLMVVAMMAAGTMPKVCGGATPCETDYLAARGAVFPAVPRAELEAFNRATLREDMTEADEMRRYVAIARFFKRAAV